MKKLYKILKFKRALTLGARLNKAKEDHKNRSCFQNNLLPFKFAFVKQLHMSMI